MPYPIRSIGDSMNQASPQTPVSCQPKFTTLAKLCPTQPVILLSHSVLCPPWRRTPGTFPSIISAWSEGWRETWPKCRNFFNRILLPNFLVCCTFPSISSLETGATYEILSNSIPYQWTTKDRKLVTYKTKRKKTRLHYKTVNLYFHCNMAIR